MIRKPYLGRNRGNQFEMQYERSENSQTPQEYQKMQEHKNQFPIKEEPLEEQFRSKCNVPKGEPEQYYYMIPPPNFKKNNNEGNQSPHPQDVFYPVLPFHESGQVYRTFAESWPDKDGNWEGNTSKNFNEQVMQKEAPQVVCVPVSYTYEPMPAYPPVSGSQELLKPWNPAQCEFQQLNGGTFYYFPPNNPNGLRPPGPPIPFKKDILAQAEKDFSDLPLDNLETLRFFYNLGVEYFRLGLFCTPTPCVQSEKSDLVKQEKHYKKKDYCRKIPNGGPYKSYRTL